MLIGTVHAFAQGSPWDNVSVKLYDSFTGTVAPMLSGAAIVVGGLTFAFGDGGGKRVLAPILFGVAAALQVPLLINWLSN